MHTVHWENGLVISIVRAFVKKKIWILGSVTTTTRPTAYWRYVHFAIKGFEFQTIAI